MTQHTIINIGRQFGAGGLQIAQKIGELLGIPVYDKELLGKAAEKSGFSKEFFEHRDEKRGFSLFHNILASGRSSGVSQNFINDDTLFRMQSTVIREIASKGPAIFVGRASNYVLRDMPNLSVFVCSPLSVRIKRVADRLNLSAAEAEALIQKKEKARREFYEFFSFGNWGASSDYDLCLNSALLGVDGSAEYIIEFAKKAGIVK